MKPTILKMPPEIEGHIMASTQLTDRQTKQNNLVLDFFNSEFVDTSGAVLLAQRIARILMEQKDPVTIQFNFKPDGECRESLASIGFFDLVGKYAEENDLFPLRNDDTRNSVQNSRGTSFPIYELAFAEAQKPRDCIPKFREWILNTISPHIGDSEFNLGQFVMLLTEIAKNSADHTNGNAFLGLDLETYEKSTRLKFSYIDLGDGIHRSVKDFAIMSEYNKRVKHMSVSESYRMAFTLGFTSKPESGVNFGLGMGSIIEFAQGLGVKLSIFDSRNRALISEIDNLSHKSIRRNFFDLRTQVGFGYYGQLTIQD